jgi:hypothetical protein
MLILYRINYTLITFIDKSFMFMHSSLCLCSPAYVYALQPMFMLSSLCLCTPARPSIFAYRLHHPQSKSVSSSAKTLHGRTHEATKRHTTSQPDQQFLPCTCPVPVQQNLPPAEPHRHRTVLVFSSAYNGNAMFKHKQCLTNKHKKRALS